MATRDLVRLYLRLDRRKEAVDLIEEALRSDRRARAEAWTLVIRQDLKQSQDLLQSGHHREAAERLDLAEANVELSLYPQVVRQNIDWTRRSIDEQTALAHYERAQHLFSQDDREGAREALEISLEIIDDGPIAASSRQLLDLIDHPDLPTATRVMTFNPSPTQKEIDHLNKLIVEKDFEKALEFLDSMRPRVGIEQRQWLDDRIREIRRAVDYNHYVDEYNRAVDFYNKRQFQEVIQVLEELLATLEEGRESDSVKALLDDARNAVNAP